MNESEFPQKQPLQQELKTLLCECGINGDAGLVKFGIEHNTAAKITQFTITGQCEEAFARRIEFLMDIIREKKEAVNVRLSGIAA